MPSVLLPPTSSSHRLRTSKSSGAGWSSRPPHPPAQATTSFVSVSADDARTRLRFWRNKAPPLPALPVRRSGTPVGSTSLGHGGSPSSVIVIEPPSPPSPTHSPVSPPPPPPHTARRRQPSPPRPAHPYSRPLPSPSPSPSPSADPGIPDRPNSRASSTGSFVRSMIGPFGERERVREPEREGGGLLRRIRSRGGLKKGESSIPPPPPPLPPSLPPTTTSPSPNTNTNRFSLLSTLTPSLRSDRSDTPELDHQWPKTPRDGVNPPEGEEGCGVGVGVGGMWDRVGVVEMGGPDGVARRSRSRGNSLSLSQSSTALLLQDSSFASLRPRTSVRSRLPSLNGPPLALRPSLSHSTSSYVTPGAIRKPSTPPRPPYSPTRAHARTGSTSRTQTKILVRSIFPSSLTGEDGPTLADLLEKFPLPPGFGQFSPPSPPPPPPPQNHNPTTQTDIALALADESFTLLDLATLDMSLGNLEGTALFERDYGEPPQESEEKEEEEAFVRAPPPSVEPLAHPFAYSPPRKHPSDPPPPPPRPTAPARLPTRTSSLRPAVRGASIHPFARAGWEGEGMEVDEEEDGLGMGVGNESSGSVRLAYAR